MKKNIIAGLSLLMVGMTVFAMQQPGVSVSLGHWKNDTNKDLLISSIVNGEERTIAQLPAGSNSNLKTAIALSPARIVRREADESLFIRDSQNSSRRFLALTAYEGDEITVYLDAVAAKFGEIWPYIRMLDNQSYSNIPAGTHIVIQGTVRGDNFEQSKIELLGVQH